MGQLTFLQAIRSTFVSRWQKELVWRKAHSKVSGAPAGPESEHVHHAPQCLSQLIYVLSVLKCHFPLNWGSRGCSRKCKPTAPHPAGHANPAMDSLSGLGEERGEEQSWVYTKRSSFVGVSGVSLLKENNGRGLLNTTEIFLFPPFMVIFGKYL